MVTPPVTVDLHHPGGHEGTRALPAHVLAMHPDN